MSDPFRLAIDTIPGLVWSSLPDGQIDFLNQRWLDYTGLPVERAIGWGWQAAVFPDDLLGLLESWKNVLASGAPGETEARLRRHDGVYRWFLFRAMPAYDAAGTVVKWYGQTTDIEDRKWAEAVLSGEKRLLEMIAKGNPLVAILDGLCRLVEHLSGNVLVSILLLDAQGKYLRHGAAPSLPASYTAPIDGRPADPDLGPCAAAARTKEQVIAADIAAETRWPEFRSLALAHGLRACWSTPITSSAGEVLGTFASYFREPTTPTAEQQCRIEQFTHLASIAIERTRDMDALRRSEERYALAVEAAGDGHTDWIVATDEFYASPRLLEMCGLAADTAFTSRGDFLNRYPFHPEDRQRVIDAFDAHCVAKTARLETETRILRRGETRWHHLTGLCSRDASGALVRWSTAVTDVTERKRAEAALRVSEQRYALAMEASGEGYWDWNIATDAYYASPRMLELFGFPPGTAFRNRADFVARFPVHSEDRSKWEEAVAARFAGKPAQDGLEIRIVPNGQTRWIHLTALLSRSATGDPLRWTGSVADITTRKQAEEALRLSEHRYALAMEATGDGHWDWNIPADKIYVSPLLLDMCGVPADSAFASRSEWVNRFPFYPGERPKYEQAVAEHFAGKTARLDMEIRIVPRGGTRWIHMTGRCSRDASGAPIRWAGSVTDVTDRHFAEDELQRMEHQLRQAQRLEAMGTLAGGIAHDFNNLLGAILGYGEMALRDVPAGSRLRRDLDSIMIAGERGRALVDRILAFSRSGMGERVAVRVEEVVRETIGLFASKLPGSVAVETQLQAGRATVMGDATQIHQVLMNLVSNAAQAMPSGGTLRVALDFAHSDVPRAVTTGLIAARDYVVLEVADTGSGIPAAILERIFDPFFTTKDVGVGTGLGLSLVHGIVTGLGGAIDVTTTVGQGSVFRVYLPAAGDVIGVDKSRKRTPTTTKTRRGARERVLVVDDEEALVGLVTETLTELGYAPTGFTASAAALAAFLADPKQFDAVVTDESMPGMSGSELIRRVRQIRPTVPILLVSGYLGTAVVQRAREAGADEVLKKPLSPRELADSLDRMLRARSRRSPRDAFVSTLSGPPAREGRRTAPSRARADRRGNGAQ